MGARWYLVHAKAGQEDLARRNLVRQGFATFLPMCLRSVRHARQIRTVLRPYFPGYLFVRLDAGADRWRSVDSTVGVLRLVKALEHPLAAPAALVDGLIRAVGPDGAVNLGQKLGVGDQVRLTHGPFADQLGEVEAMAPRDRVRVLLSLMHAKLPVEVARSACAPA